MKIRSYKISAILFFIIILICPFIEAQDYELKILSVNVDSFPKVQTKFNVYEKYAQPIKNLSKNQIEIYESEKRIKRFNLKYINNERKLKLAILLDVSGSMNENQKNTNAENAINELLNIIDRSRDECALVTFCSEVKTLSSFTNDFSFISNSISSLNYGGDTKLYDAVYDATKLFSTYDSSRKAIILVTDGKDDGSLFDLETAIKYSKKAGVEIYSIGIGSDADIQTLGTLAKKTGSGFYGRVVANRLRFVLQNIYSILTKNYIISYATPDSIVEKQGNSRTIALKTNYNNLPRNETVQYEAPSYNPTNYTLFYYIGIVALVFIVLIIIVIIIVRRRGGNKEEYHNANQEMFFEQAQEVDENNNPANDDFDDYGEEDDEDTVVNKEYEDEEPIGLHEQPTIVVSKGKTKTDHSLGYLVMKSKKYGTNIYELRQKELIIGRGADSDILLEDEEISRLNTKVRFFDGKFYVDDMGSTSGTYINGEETFHSELKDGDTLEVGEHQFVFKCIE